MDEIVEPRRVRGTLPLYAAALVSMIVSLNTSWNFFGDVLGVTDQLDRDSMFFVLELAQFACGWGMRASVRDHGKPGPTRLFAWALCGVSAYMAWALAGPIGGTARVLLGPILSLVMLHLALGVEIRSLKKSVNSLLVRVSRELRERFLATLGLGDETRDAATIRRQRAARRATRLRMTSRGSRRSKRRFVENLAIADIANNPAELERFINGMKLAANVDEVWELKYPMLFQVPGATSLVAPGTEDDTVALDTDATESDTATGDVAPDTVALAPLSDRVQAEVDTILRLIEVNGVDVVTIDFVKDQVGLKHSTAARRLRVAKEQLAS